MSKHGNIKRWDVVKINDDDGIRPDHHKHNYVGAEAVVTQILKSGLFFVETRDGTKLKLAKKNLTFVREPEASAFPTGTLESTEKSA
jgi:hypothetical protein